MRRVRGTNHDFGKAPAAANAGKLGRNKSRRNASERQKEGRRKREGERENGKGLTVTVTMEETERGNEIERDKGRGNVQPCTCTEKRPCRGPRHLRVHTMRPVGEKTRVRRRAPFFSPSAARNMPASLQLVAKDRQKGAARTQDGQEAVVNLCAS